MLTNEQRAEHADGALATYQHEKGEAKPVQRTGDQRDAIGDLIADLLHLLDATHDDPQPLKLLERAINHFEEERTV